MSTRWGELSVLSEIAQSWGTSLRMKSNRLLTSPEFVRRSPMMEVRVESYAGYKAEERPIRFQLDGCVHTVEELLDQWYSPDATYFRVRADDGNLYVLRHGISPQQDVWTLESFRQG
jgi:hypothetical protein